MLHLFLSLQNPWHNEEKSPFVSYWDKTWSLTKHKAVELQLSRYTYNLATLVLDTRFTGRDHAGIKFTVSLLGYEFDANLYDTRHWNDEAGRWNTEDEYGQD
jgi:hypothetical protein